MKKAHIAVNLRGADWTGPQEGSDIIDFQRFKFLVAFLVAVVPKNAVFLQKRTSSNETIQRSGYSK